MDKRKKGILVLGLLVVLVVLVAVILAVSVLELGFASVSFLLLVGVVLGVVLEFILVLSNRINLSNLSLSSVIFTTTLLYPKGFQKKCGVSLCQTQKDEYEDTVLTGQVHPLDFFGRHFIDTLKTAFWLHADRRFGLTRKRSTSVD